MNAATASGFIPAVGASFPIVTYASETGGDSLSFNGVNSGALSVFQPVVGPTNITLSTVTSPANLVVQPFSVMANATVGQNLTVTYQVDNDSSNAASGSWTDSVYLSTQPTLNASSVLLGQVDHTGGVAANGHYSGTVTEPVPGLLPDDYYVIVLADSLGLVPELNRTSTELASTNPVEVTVPALDLGSPISGTIRDGQSFYYQLTASAGQDVAVSAGFAALQGGELYIGYQSVPSSSANLVSSTSPNQTTQQVMIPDTQAGTYYVLVQGDTGSGSGSPFTLSRPQHLHNFRSSERRAEPGREFGNDHADHPGSRVHGRDVGQPGSPWRRDSNRGDAGDVSVQHDHLRPVQPGWRGCDSL